MHSRVQTFAAFIGAGFLIASTSPGQTAQHASGSPASHTPRADTSDPALGDLIRRFDVDESYVSRFQGSRWSAARMDRMRRVYKDYQSEVASIDFQKLGIQGKIDALLMRNRLELGLARLDLDAKWLSEMAPALPFSETILSLEATRRKLEDVSPDAAATQVAAIPELVKAARAAIELGRQASPAAPAEGGTQPITLSPTVARRAAAATDELRGVLGGWAGYYEGYKPEFGWWLRAPREAAERSLEEYAKFLRETVAGIRNEPADPLIGDPIGEAALAADLRSEMIAYTPAELIEIANREFAWCETQMKAASNEMGFGDDWKAALSKVKQAHVPPGEQDRYVRDVAREAIAWLKERDLLTIPQLCEESWRIEMHTPDQQRYWPFAVYGGQYMGVSYPTITMPHDDKLMSLRGNNRHFTRLVTPHELIPGHHLQGFMESRIRPYRQSFSTPFFVEGWALYWEMEMWDRGWAQSAEDRIGMLFWRMHRCARIIVSLKFHVGEMSPAEMVTFLVDRVGHETFGATSEVRRYIAGDYSPLYQCGYMIGGLQVRALHKELVGAGTMTDKQFNDALLTYGPIPNELIRAGMTNAPLTMETRATWRFADK